MAFEHLIIAARSATTRPSLAQIAHCLESGEIEDLSSDPERAFELYFISFTKV